MPAWTALPTATVGGRQIDLAPLETINYARLLAKEAGEIEKLLKAAQSPGFFYVDLRGDSSVEVILGDVRDMYAISEQYFDQPYEAKMKHYREGQDRGYKPGEHEETFEVAREEMMSGEALVLPNVLDEKRRLLGRLSSSCHSVVWTMLCCLSDALQLDDASRLENRHRDGEHSDTGLKLIYEPAKEKMADVIDGTHTDSGTLTILFGEPWGAEIEMPETKEWAFVEPKAGCGLVNVADSLQSMSNNRLYSCRHSVSQPTDGFQKRHYVVYFLRPEKAVGDQESD